MGKVRCVVNATEQVRLIKTSYTKMEIRISYDEWHKKYKPYDDGNLDEYPIDCDPVTGNVSQKEWETALQENRVWTLISTDGPDYNEHGEPNPNTAIISGFRWVNRLEHYITEVPYDPSETIEVYD
jgi:hypothetical protein